MNLVTCGREGCIFKKEKVKKPSQTNKQITYTHFDPHTVLNAEDKTEPRAFPLVVECASTGRGLVNRRFFLVL